MITHFSPKLLQPAATQEAALFTCLQLLAYTTIASLKGLATRLLSSALTYAVVRAALLTYDDVATHSPTNRFLCRERLPR